MTAFSPEWEATRIGGAALDRRSSPRYISMAAPRFGAAAPAAMQELRR